MWTMNFQMFKLDLEKAEGPEINLPTSTGSSKKQEFQKNMYFCFIDYAKAFDCVDVGNLISGSSAFFWNQLEHLEVHSSRIAEAWLGEFWALLY